MFKWEGEVWQKKISNNNFRTITQGFLSSSFAFLLLVCYTAVFRVVTWEGALRDDTKNGCIADYPIARWFGLRLTRSQLTVSLLLYFNEVSAVKGRAWHTCYPNTDDWERVRLYVEVAPSPPFP